MLTNALLDTHHGVTRCDRVTSRAVYTATNEDTARANLDAFEASELGLQYPQSVKVWRDAWERFVPFLQFPPAARRVLYTTNSIESLNA